MRQRLKKLADFILRRCYAKYLLCKTLLRNDLRAYVLLTVEVNRNPRHPHECFMYSKTDNAGTS